MSCDGTGYTFEKRSGDNKIYLRPLERSDTTQREALGSLQCPEQHHHDAYIRKL